MKITTEDKKKIDRLYKSISTNTCSNQFLDQLSSGFSYTINNKDINRFYSFTPRDCKLEKMINNASSYLYFDIERAIDSSAYDLISYGKGYIYLCANKETINKDQENNVKESLHIYSVRGFCKKDSNGNKVFASNLNNEFINIENIVTLDLKDIGYKRNHFRKIANKLNKIDILKQADFLTENVDGYETETHNNKNKLSVLKATKNTGYYFGMSDISDSYILFKQKQLLVFKIEILEYILKKMDNAFKEMLGDDCGELIANIRDINYEEVWLKYRKGEITHTNLSDILYQTK